MSSDRVRNPFRIGRRQRMPGATGSTPASARKLQILLLDRSTFGIGASSSVRIDRYVYDPNQGRSVVATILQGRAAVLLGREEGNNSAEVNTPSGRIGIRGTALDLLVGEEAKDIAEDEDFVDDAIGPDGKKNEATLVVLRGPGAGNLGGLTAAAGGSRIRRRDGCARSARPRRLHPARRRGADRAILHLERGTRQGPRTKRARTRA
jgi:hypothetical protein